LICDDDVGDKDTNPFDLLNELEPIYVPFRGRLNNSYVWFGEESKNEFDGIYGLLISTKTFE
jgi:hypothetical protein